MTARRIYLDHAATSWPKPPGVVDACVHYQNQIGAAASRGAYRSSFAADQLLNQVREQMASWIGAKHAQRTIAFVSNGTMALHAILHGWLHATDLSDVHVLVTATEHNSVLRPLAALARTRGLQWSAVPCDSDGGLPMDRLRESIRPNTQLLLINHGSNVTGNLIDLEAIANLAHEHRIPLAVDAAQTLGYVDIDVERLGIAMLAAPCHKGACGMLGTGVVYVREDLLERMVPPWIGGTGSHSDSLLEDFTWRESIESGNINMPSIASLGAGLSWLKEHRHQIPLESWTQRMIETICEQPALRLVGTEQSKGRLPVISITHARMDCHEMAMVLDSTIGIEARSGFHCAALIHRYLQTDQAGGTLRFSMGHTSSQEDVEAACEGIRLLGEWVA